MPTLEKSPSGDVVPALERSPSAIASVHRSMSFKRIVLMTTTASVLMMAAIKATSDSAQSEKAPDTQPTKELTKPTETLQNDNPAAEALKRQKNIARAAHMWNAKAIIMTPESMIKCMEEMDRLLADANCTRADIDVSEEMVAERWQKIAEEYWMYAQGSLTSQSMKDALQHMTAALEKAHCTPESIGATSEAIRACVVALAKEEWERTVRFSQAAPRMFARDALKETSVLLQFANASREEIGITDEAWEEVEARLSAPKE